MKDPRDIIKRPLITEKANKLKEDNNQYSFEVDRRANKIEIRKAVESLFSVQVLKVQTVKNVGKMVRVGRNRGKRPDWKKAVVTLAQGNRIEFFEGV
jgi:large subunit ribosomal protein L23